MRLRWTQSARNDLREIHAYIARDSKFYAKRMIDRIKQGVKRLVDFPESGWQVEEYGRKDILEIVVGVYRIIYKLEKKVVRILAVIHGARRLPPELGASNGNGEA